MATHLCGPGHLRIASSLVSSSVLCCIMDGMDQAKFKTPRYKLRPSKRLESLYRPTLHCSANWLHGYGLGLFISPEDLKKNSETQIEVLFLGLSRLKDDYGQLPMGLHLQQDNCYREGKNQFLTAAMMMLVVLRIFRHTALGFLRTGHSSPACTLVSYFSFYLVNHSANQPL